MPGSACSLWTSRGRAAARSRWTKHARQRARQVSPGLTTSGTTGARPRSLARLASSGVVDPLRNPVVLDGVVSDEKLSELLALGTEYAELDFKATIDLTDTKQALELVRDVDGMLVRGGPSSVAGVGSWCAPRSVARRMCGVVRAGRLRARQRVWRRV